MTHYRPYKDDLISTRIEADIEEFREIIWYVSPAKLEEIATMFREEWLKNEKFGPRPMVHITAAKNMILTLCCNGSGLPERPVRAAGDDR